MSKILKHFLDFEIYEKAEVDTISGTLSSFENTQNALNAASSSVGFNNQDIINVGTVNNVDVSSLDSDFNDHENTENIHRQHDDNIIASTCLWSSQKINTISGTLSAEIDSDIITFSGTIDHDTLINYSIDEHRTIDDGATSSTDLWSAQQINAVSGTLQTAIDAKSEEEGDRDIYQDLLSNSIYLNMTWDGFIDQDLVDTTISGIMTYNSANDEYDFTAGEILQSKNLYDSTLSGTLDTITEAMISIDYTDTETPTIKATADGGTHWETVDNNVIYTFTNTGNDLRIQYTAGGTGSVRSWAVIYNPDPNGTLNCSVSRRKYITFYYEGICQISDIIDGFYFDNSIGISAITLHTRVAPTGSNLTIDITKDGVEQSKVATLTAAAIYEKTTYTSPLNFSSSERFGLTITAIGSSEPGQGLTVILHYYDR